MKINLEKVTKIYSREKRKFTVLNDLNLSLPDRKLTLISGESGSGKSTLLNMISGLSRPTSGKIFFDRTEITGLNENELSDFRKSNLGIVTQNCELVPFLTLSENIQMVFEIRNSFTGKNTDYKDWADELTGELGLKPLMNELPVNLSGGEIKRASVVRALIARPEVVIMDEPTANLDSRNVDKILKLLRSYCDSGKTVIVSSHERETINYSDNNIRLELQ